VEPFFKKGYEDKVCYFELTEEVKRSREVFCAYARHVLEMMLKA
jgi:hypothetical protein